MKKEGEKRKHEAARQGDGDDGRVQQGVTAVTSMEKEIPNLNHSAEGSSCMKNRAESLLYSCKSAGRNPSPACAITTLHKTSEKI